MAVLVVVGGWFGGEGDRRGCGKRWESFFICEHTDWLRLKIALGRIFFERLATAVVVVLTMVLHSNCTCRRMV
jgi:hypothetical protein